MQNKPTYSIESVDHALRLAVLLHQEGPMRVSEVAARLGVANSTAHRLLAMLVYRDFAVQGADRSYAAGPILERAGKVASTAQLRVAALPHLEALMHRGGETTHLQVLAGDQVRFVATVECRHILRVGDREGRMLPAHRASAGLAILAGHTDEQIDLLFAEDSQVDVPALKRTLARARALGYAINDQATEAGVSAVGVALRRPGAPTAGISVAMPTVRFHRNDVKSWVSLLGVARSRIERDWAESTAA